MKAFINNTIKLVNIHEDFIEKQDHKTDKVIIKKIIFIILFNGCLKSIHITCNRT